MNPVRYVSEQRRRQIHSHAAEHLAEGEEITHFARMRHPETRKKGFIYMVEGRVIVAWKSDEEPAISVPLDDITAWGVNHDHRGGPVLCIETPTGTQLVQLLTSSRAMTEGVIRFLLMFGERIPQSAIASLEDGEHSFVATDTLKVKPEQLSVQELTKRIIVTVLGVALILGAIVIIPLPGPWSFLVVIAGLAILATEYDWAEDALDWVKLKYKRARDKIRARRQAQS